MGATVKRIRFDVHGVCITHIVDKNTNALYERVGSFL